MAAVGAAAQPPPGGYPHPAIEEPRGAEVYE